MATRQRLFETAMAAFRREGLDRADVGAITKAVGVSRASFYHYFPTKDHVIAAWLLAAETRLVAEVASVRAEGLRPVLDRAAEILAEEWEREPRLLLNVTLVAQRAAVLATTGRSSINAPGELHALPGTLASSVLAAHFRSAAQRGEVAGSMPPEVLAALFLGTLLAAALPRRVDPPAGRLPELLCAAVECFLSGAQAGRPSVTSARAL
jgi:AcrR family transcriptional regulator